MVTSAGDVRLTARVTFRAGLMWATGLLLLVVIVGSLTLQGDTRALVVDGLMLLTVWISAVVCWLAAS